MAASALTLGSHSGVATYSGDPAFGPSSGGLSQAVKDTTSTALMAVLMRVDVFTLWVTFLLAVGLRVVGKVPMSKALVAAGVVWVLGGLFTFLTSGLAG